MNITAIVIPVDFQEDIRLQEIDNHDLDAYRDLVGGDIEVINLQRPPASLYVNEEGKLRHAAVNLRATTMLWAHNSAYRGRDGIVGPAFVVGPPDRHGDDRTAPQDLVDLLFNTKRYQVQVQVGASKGWVGNQEVFDSWFEAYVYGVQLAQRWVLVDEVRVVPVLDQDLRETWYKIGLDNMWIRAATDPAFTRDSFVGTYSVEELAERITQVSWTIGTAFYYRDLCFIEQVDGGDEWLTIRHGFPFESMTLKPRIENGSFPKLIRRLLTATKEQCERLTY